MPRSKQGKELDMKYLYEVLRLHYCQKLSQGEIAQSCGISKSSVSRYLKRYREAELGDFDPNNYNELVIRELLQPNREAATRKAVPDLAYIHEELKRPGVTLQLLWEEWSIQIENPCNYSSYCSHYYRYKKNKNLSMRQEHKAGEKLFVDYAGQTMEVWDSKLKRKRPVQIFVASFGLSNYTYVEATWSQKVPDWLGSHVRAFEFFGGLPNYVVPDNLKSGVKSPCFYDPVLNPGYQQLADHYELCVLPARVRKPKDKSKVENAVQNIERRILAKLRNQTFYDLRSLNVNIWRLLKEFNDKPFSKMPGSRRSHFEKFDKPFLRALPDSPFTVYDWKQAKVNIDYHIVYNDHFYSVPFQYVGKKVMLKASDTLIEIFHEQQKIATHLRSCEGFRHTTTREHMPKKHQQAAGYSSEQLIKKGGVIGENTKCVIQALIDKKPYPEQAFRSCLGILRLAEKYSGKRLEAACQKSFNKGILSYAHLSEMLKNNQESLVAEPLPLSLNQEKSFLRKKSELTPQSKGA